MSLFCRNDRQLQGQAGAVAVLHTHSRRLDYHPYVHLAMPGAALDPEKRLWRRRSGKRSGYLFNHRALAKAPRVRIVVASIES